MAHTLYNVFFSPTRGTEAITEKVAGAIAKDRNLSSLIINLTKPSKRPVPISGEAGDVLVFGFPVYAGRVPTILMESIALLDGKGATAVVVGVYGNRNYDDALLEAADLLTMQGFNVIAAGAFIAEHSMTPRVGKGRPDRDDLSAAARFGHDIAALLKSGKHKMPSIKGNRPYRDGMPDANTKPSTTAACTACGICTRLCPMGIIDVAKPAKVGSGCLQCNACVKECPENAKLFDAEGARKLVALLEGACMTRKEPELFL